MPRYEPKGAIEAHRTDAGDEYLLMLDGSFGGVMDAGLFERVFRESALSEKELAFVDARPITFGPEFIRRRESLPGTPDDQVRRPDLAAAIAARTVPGGPGSARLPRDQTEVDRILEETRRQVDGEIADRPEIDGGEAPTPEPPPAAKNGLGRGYKACRNPKCKAVNGCRARACRDCGRKF